MSTLKSVRKLLKTDSLLEISRHLFIKKEIASHEPNVNLIMMFPFRSSIDFYGDILLGLYITGNPSEVFIKISGGRNVVWKFSFNRVRETEKDIFLETNFGNRTGFPLVAQLFQNLHIETNLPNSSINFLILNVFGDERKQLAMNSYVYEEKGLILKDGQVYPILKIF